MSIEVNGVQYEGILFAKLPDEGYAEPTPKVAALAEPKGASSPIKESQETTTQNDESSQLQVDEPMTTDGTVVVEPTEPVESQN